MRRLWMRYFSILGNCPNIEQKQQIKLAAEYHAEVQQCQQVMNKIPGKVGFLLQVLTEIGNGERLENFVVSDKAVRKQEFFEGLQKLAALKNPDLAHWHIRPMLMLNWSRGLIENYHKLPPSGPGFTRSPEQTSKPPMTWLSG